MKPTNVHRTQVVSITMQVMDLLINGKKSSIQYEGYLEHFISERFTYVVALKPKGRIEITRDAAREHESSGAITMEEITEIAKTYKDS